MNEDSILAAFCKNAVFADKVQLAKLDYFTGINSVIISLLKLHYTLYAKAPTLDSLSLILRQRKASKAKAKEVLTKFVYLANLKNVNLEQWDIDKFFRDSEERILLETLSMAADALETGVEFKGKYYNGYEGAQALLDRAVGGLRSFEHSDVDPFAAYKRRKDNREGLEIPILSNLVGSLYPGDEVVLAGYSGEGKTTLAANVTCQSFLQGKSVLYLNLEGPSYIIYWRLASMLSGKNGSAKIPYGKIRRGTLSSGEEQEFSGLVESLKEKIEVVSLPISVGAPSILSFCRNKFRVKRFDLVVLDYAGLAAGSVSSLGQVFRECKEVAKSCETVTVVLHQTNREGWKEALKAGRYNLTSLSETYEAERTTDVVIWVLKLSYLRSRIGIAKFRDEAKDLGKAVEVVLDEETYAYSLKVGLEEDLSSIGAPTLQWKSKKEKTEKSNEEEIDLRSIF